MNIPELGVLTEVDVREAWAHEAHSFTRLAEHLDALATAIGIPLQLEGREVAVETFYADILARNPRDDSLVLVENQLEGADHGHLGQIMTYLAGLKARTIVWVAPHFREAHLSALSWLNDNAKDETGRFAFFGVKVRAVRIGESPIAPFFEVEAKPNWWQQQLQDIAEASHDLSSLGQVRREFWEAYVKRFPDELAWGPPTASSNRWRSLDDVGLVISMYLAARTVGLFIRSPRGMPKAFAYDRLLPHTSRFAAAFGAELSRADDGYYFPVERPGDTSNDSTWPDLTDWLHSTANAYQAELTSRTEAPTC